MQGNGVNNNVQEQENNFGKMELTMRDNVNNFS